MPELDLPAIRVRLQDLLPRNGAGIEAALVFAREQPGRLPSLLGWALAGGKGFASRLDQMVELDAASLPYNEELLEYLRSRRRDGRRIVLVADGYARQAKAISEFLRLFDGIVAPIAADMTGTPGDLRKGHDTGVRASAYDWTRALRLHQWLKNLLIFVPLLAAHKYNEWRMVLDAVIAFFCFGLVASSVYILNDLLDLRDDRAHATKRHRPFASGRIPASLGLLATPLLLGAAVALSAVTLQPTFLAALATYFALTLAYSLTLKRRMVVDVVTLAALYTLRIIAGAVALDIAPSFWLLAFSMFLFLSLALVKRYAELFSLRAQGLNEKAKGRGYWPDDLGMIAALGAASGYLSVMVLALYIDDARTMDLYRHPHFIWLACPILLTWISRTWMLTHRGHMNEDPVIFAVRDRISIVLGALLALIFWAAT